MSARPSLFFPLILPPEKDPSNPPGYYTGLGTSVDVADLADGGIAISFTNPASAHPAAQSDSPPALSTVIAPSRGFVRYYPAASTLPTSAGQPLDLPPTIQTPDVGTLVLQFWPADRRRIGHSFQDGETVPTHLLLQGVQRASVETALATEVSTLSLNLLRRSWVAAGGTIQSPSDPTPAALRAAYLQRVMSTDKGLFVAAGAPLGLAALIDDPPGTQKGWLRLSAMALDAANVPADAEIDGVIDGIADHAPVAASGTMFKDHPLDKETDTAATVQFTVKAMIWDRTQRKYVPFVGGNVTLRLQEGNQSLGVQTTNANGEATFSATLKKRDEIAFEYDTKLKTFANRTFPEAIRSEPRKAKNYIGSNNNSSCYAKYTIYDQYVGFFKKLRTNSNVEKFGIDRGNAAAADTALASNQEDRRIERLKDFESFYIAGPATQPTFNVLFEGDSWFDYPLTWGDIYNHLEKIMRTKVKQGLKYNVIALQHFGDRSDQMFKIVDSSGEGQWKYTKDIFSEYPIDLVILSSGGNDFAEPGISAADQGRYSSFWTPGFFDAKEALKPGTGLNPVERPIATRLMSQSFSILLSNHPWNRAFAGIPPSAVNQGLVQKLEAMGTGFGQATDSLDDIGNNVIDHFNPIGQPSKLHFPPTVVTAEDGLLADIFDGSRLMQRYQDMYDNLTRFLDIVVPYNTQVVAHSYCYPLFRTAHTSVTGLDLAGWDEQSGPWFIERFKQAGITDPRVQKVALKSLIDNYVRLVLEKIKQKPAYNSMFDYADLRAGSRISSMWRAESYWRDEMHLRSDSFRALAERIFAVIRPKFLQTKLD